MSPLDPPPGDLSGFPSFPLVAAKRVYRIFHRDHLPWWFSSDGSGRFDLTVPSGTCYLAEEPLGAFVEVFRDTNVIDEADVTERLLATVVLPDVTQPLADCTLSAARGFGVTGAIHTTDDYDVTQTWARAFARAGFSGIRYFGAHDPSQNVVSVAYFGRAGEQNYPVLIEPIDGTIVTAAYQRFGLLVLPAPRP